MRIALPIVSAVWLTLCGCDHRPDQWDAFVYPDTSDLNEVAITRGFKSFELCQQAAIEQMRRMPDPDGADYECGYRCEYRPSFGFDVCKETRK